MSNLSDLSLVIVRLVITVLCIVIPPLLTPVIVKFLEMLKSKIESINNNKINIIFNNSIELLEKVVRTTVEYLEQEYANAIRKGIENGTNKREELFKLKDKAIEIVKSQVSTEIMDLIHSRIPDIDDYIGNLISQAVFDIKRSNK